MIKVFNLHEKNSSLRTIFGYFISYPKNSRNKFYCSNRNMRIVEYDITRFLEDSNMRVNNPKKVI